MEKNSNLEIEIDALITSVAAVSTIFGISNSSTILFLISLVVVIGASIGLYYAIQRNRKA